jgi:polysaccharide pyruvyl transferase WcaK-like protein
MRVLLRGYYGFRNTGDDALLAATALGVHRAFGDAIAVTALASAVPAFPGSGLIRPAFPAVPRWRGERRVRLWAEALRASAVVFGGGSVFHAGAGLAQLETLLRVAGRGPHLAAGVSLGPFRSAREERACARVLRRLAFLGLRDEESAALARVLAPGVPSRLTFDLAPLLLDMEDGAPAAPAGRRGLGIALCDYERFTGGDVRREAARRGRIARALRALDRELVDELVLVDFNGDPAVGDAVVHTDLAARVADAGVPIRHVRYDPRPLEVLRTIGSLRAIVAMRLHAAVFAYLARTPAVILSYHPKCRGWAGQAGVPASMVHDSVDFEPADLARAIEAALRGSVPAPSLPLESALDQARLNFPAM